VWLAADQARRGLGRMIEPECVYEGSDVRESRDLIIGEGSDVWESTDLTDRATKVVICKKADC
jgi:hypothetical protein